MKKNKQLFTTLNTNIHSKTVRPLNFPWRHLLLLLHFCLRSKVCHLNAMASSGGVMDEIIDRRNKAVTFIALSDLLRHRPNKQKAKLIVPDHIGAVTPAPDPAFVSRTLGCHLWSHCSPPFTTKNKQLKGRDRSYPWALNMGIRSVGWPIKWFPIEGRPTVRWVNESHLARLLLNIQTQIPPLCPQSRHGPRWRPSATGFWVPKEKGKLTKYVCLNIYRRSTSATMMSHSWFCFTIVAQKKSVWADWTNSTHLEMHSTKSHPISSANINCNLYFCCNFSNKSPVFGNIFALTVLLLLLQFSS